MGRPEPTWRQSTCVQERIPRVDGISSPFLSITILIAETNDQPGVWVLEAPHTIYHVECLQPNTSHERPQPYPEMDGFSQGNQPRMLFGQRGMQTFIEPQSWCPCRIIRNPSQVKGLTSCISVWLLTNQPFDLISTRIKRDSSTNHVP